MRRSCFYFSKDILVSFGMGACAGTSHCFIWWPLFSAARTRSIYTRQQRKLLINGLCINPDSLPRRTALSLLVASRKRVPAIGATVGISPDRLQIQAETNDCIDRRLFYLINITGSTVKNHWLSCNYSTSYIPKSLPKKLLRCIRLVDGYITPGSTDAVPPIGSVRTAFPQSCGTSPIC